MRRWTLLCVVVAACGGSPPSSPTFTNVQNRVFTSSCAVSGCHAGSSPEEGLNLTAPAYANIVNMASMEVPTENLVTPGDPTESYLYEKLSSASPQVGSQMPVGQTLDQSLVDLVQQWIMAGAPDN